MIKLIKKFSLFLKKIKWNAFISKELIDLTRIRYITIIWKKRKKKIRTLYIKREY